MKCLNCQTSFKPKRKDALFCSPRCRVAYNRKRNTSVTDMENSDKVILSLCDYSGTWSRPYREAGYTVRQVDLNYQQDVRFLEYPGKVYGVLAAPPCTEFAISGARYWKKKGVEALKDALSIFDACCRIVLFSCPDFWVFENPIGRLKRYIGEPRFMFDPCEFSRFGENYTKKTCLWGEFTPPRPDRTLKPLEKPTGHHSIDAYWKRQGEKLGTQRQALRSITPLGFAYAFFEANQ